jgi:hypothetical protein
MIVNTLEIKRSEWECYTDTPDVVIEEVNELFLEILNTTQSPVLAQKRTYDAMFDYRQYGFMDSECSQCITDVINKYYNSNIDRWAVLFYNTTTSQTKS